MAAAMTLVTAAAVGCASRSGADQPGRPLTQCGTTLEEGGGEGDVYLARLRPVSAHPGEPGAPRRSLIPSTRQPLHLRGPVPKVVVLTTDDCADAPVVTVQPADAARTEAVAHGSNGGIAGLILVPSGRTLIVRAYLHGQLIGQVTLLHGYLPSQPATSSARA